MSPKSGVMFENHRIRAPRAVRLVTAVIVMVMAGAASAADVSGNWTLTISDPLGRDTDVPMTLEQDGEALTGRVGGSPLEGTIDDNEITMRYNVDSGQVGVITLTYSGTLDGDAMRGDVDFGGFAGGSWMAVRTD